eukprot:TRINITY_DN2734_c0_g1_i3.p1 TRINITY_DN2734_c0_g1~~TRINITY_DN2734_c0_g1_i3.p1  ORF type:complete len:287 (+),score=54.98 TRINITY_DN2734_c0_g1_i3:87-863(+)
MAHGMAVNVVTGDGPPLCVELGPDATVGDLRAAAAEAGLKADQAVLTFAGQELDNAATLADVGIGAEATVHASIGAQLHWETNSAHAVIDGKKIGRVADCAVSGTCPATCGQKATLWLARHAKDTGMQSGILRWRLGIYLTEEGPYFGVAAGVAHVPCVQPSAHFNSQQNSEYTWMFFGRWAYHHGQSRPTRFGNGGSASMSPGRVVQFELDMDEHKLTASVDGVPLAEPIATNLPDLPLLPFIELQECSDSAELLAP